MTRHQKRERRSHGEGSSSDYQESERRASRLFAFCRSCEVVRTKGGIHATVPTCRDRAAVREPDRGLMRAARVGRLANRRSRCRRETRETRRHAPIARRAGHASRSRGRGSGPTRYIVWYSVVGTTHGTYVGEKLNEKNYMLRRWRDSRVSGRAPVLYNSPSCSRRFCTSTPAALAPIMCSSICDATLSKRASKRSKAAVVASSRP